MIIIGEKLNSSIPKTMVAIKNSDEEYLIALIKAQEACGANYLDLNTAICGEEEEQNKLIWLTELVMKHSKCGIMLDSPNPKVIKEAIKTIKDRKVIINSVTLTDRIDKLLPVVKATGAGVVALPIDGVGIPNSVEKRVGNAKLLVKRLTAYGIAEDKIFIDVLAEALSVGNDNAIIAIETAKQVNTLYPNVHTICGLSNISFGLPKRKYINSAFLSIAIASGLDSAILDITSKSVRATIFSALAACGKDDYCMDYIGFIRELEG